MFVAPTFALHPVYAAAIALALASPAACLAADWVRVPAAGVDQHFYDQSKVSISGDEVTYWRKSCSLVRCASRLEPRRARSTVNACTAAFTRCGPVVELLADEAP